jgi:hypothetical protein
MNAKIETDAQFLASLDRAQKRYFLMRERERQALLQASLRDLSRGLGVVGALHGESLVAGLAGDG